MVREKEYLRFKWSHDLALHRLAVRIYNRVMQVVPFTVKYGLGQKLRRKSPPYCFIAPGSVVVQVGAPQDTLRAGRSRGMYFSFFAGAEGKVVIIEPDRESVQTFTKVAKKQGIHNLVFCPTAVWSEKKMLKVYINDAHPASNFTEGTKSYDAERLKAFRTVEIPTDTMDNILAEQGIDRADLVSITTNGAEQEILKGMQRLVATGLPYISLARTGENYVEMMAGFGYELLTHDDRGFTFRQKATARTETS